MKRSVFPQLEGVDFTVAHGDIYFRGHVIADEPGRSRIYSSERGGFHFILVNKTAPFPGLVMLGDTPGKRMFFPYSCLEHGNDDSVILTLCDGRKVKVYWVQGIPHYTYLNKEEERPLRGKGVRALSNEPRTEGIHLTNKTIFYYSAMVARLPAVREGIFPELNIVPNLDREAINAGWLAVIENGTPVPHIYACSKVSYEEDGAITIFIIDGRRMRLWKEEGAFFYAFIN